MKTTKHIQALTDSLGLGRPHAEVLQYLWANREKPGLICLNVVSVSKSGMSRQFKAVIHHKGSFVDITRLMSLVTENTYNKISHTISIGGCGMDMGFALLEQFYTKLVPQTVKVSVFKFHAVQSYFYL